MRKAIQDKTAGSMLVKTKFDPTFLSGSNARLEPGAWNQMSEPEKVKARTIFTLLRGHHRAWQSLGEIAIADYVNGNADRLDLEVGRPQVQNYGNLIFSIDSSNNITHAMGLDAFDPHSADKFLLDADIDNWIENFGQHIKDKGRFPITAQKIIAYINKDRMTPLGLTEYGNTEGLYLAEGMVMGWNKQAQTMKAKVWGQKNVPAGLLARAKYLGWA